MKRILAVILALCMFCGVLSSCGQSAQESCDKLIESIVQNSGYVHEDENRGELEDGQTYCTYTNKDGSHLGVSVRTKDGNPHRIIYRSVNSQEAEKMLPFILEAVNATSSVNLDDTIDNYVDVGNGFSAFSFKDPDSEEAIILTVTETE